MDGPSIDDPITRGINLVKGRMKRKQRMQMIENLVLQKHRAGAAIT